MLGDLLDLHAALARGDHAHALGLAIQHDAEINLTLEFFRDLHVHALHDLALGPGLMRDEPLAEQRLRGFVHLVIGPAQSDAPGLAARARMDLRLYRPMPAAELGGG